MDSCGYCGEPANTVDHVVASTLLVDKGTSVQIPACSKCNGEKSKEDVYLRDMFTIRSETAGLPELAPHGEAMKRSIDRAFGPSPRIGPAVSILKTFKHGHVLGPMGERRAYVELDAARLNEGVKWIVRGLHYHHFKAILDPTKQFDFYAYQGQENNLRYDLLWPTIPGPDITLGGCLRYKVRCFAELPGSSQWLLAFYNHVLFFVEFNWQPAVDAIEALVQAREGREGTARLTSE